MKHLLALVVLASLLGAGPAVAENDQIDVMTQNQYLGADLTPVVAAGTPQEFQDALIEALQQIAANDLPARAEKLAELIADRLPEVVGLQEMFLFTCTPLAAPVSGFGCDDPSIAGAFNDHLDLTLDNLDALGETYVDVAIVENLDTMVITVPPVPIPGLPIVINGFPIVINALDRDVILVRGDIAGTASPASFFCANPSVDGCNYAVAAPANTPVGALEFLRGLVGVVLTVDGKDYRVVNTHLEVQQPDGTPASSIVQALQAAELIGTLAATTPPGVSLIAVGDINSSPDDPIFANPTQPNPFPPPFDALIIPPYAQLVGSGYTDAWTLRPGNLPGYSCCQDDDLLNHQSVLDERVDVIFSVEVPAKVKKARVLGAKVSDKTSPPGQGLWPSDHGSVAAELQFD